jgi:hypothetical protein
VHHDAGFGVAFGMTITRDVRTRFEDFDGMASLRELIGNDGPGKTGADNRNVLLHFVFP